MFVALHDPAQRSFEDLGTPLEDVTFCVIDFETTGSSAEHCTITEIGAVKLRGGACLGTLQTLVNPGCAIPPTITVLTGITEAMVTKAPRIESVLGTLVDFIGDAVIVGHNVRFDMSFLQAALRRDDRPELENPTIDTVALARRLMRDEVPNCKLGTLARHCRLDHQPSHRALDDALATGDLLHVLLDRCRALGVTGLDDLRSLPRMAGHAQAAKLKLTDRLPRSPGVYLFRGRTGEVLYVGKATNLRSRVRSYFSTDERRKIGPLLAQTEHIDFKRTATVLEAEVLEVRLIHHLEPSFNRESNRWRSSVYVKLTDDAYPRLSIVKECGTDGATYLGPIGSRSAATLVIDAVQTVVPLRRCAGRVTSKGPCLAAQLGVANCPCTGSVTPQSYERVAALARRALTSDPGIVIDALTDRMRDLAAEERFEEAADLRDRLAAFAEAVGRQRRLDRARSTNRLVVEDEAGHRFEFRRGQLMRHWAPPATADQEPRLDGVDHGRIIEATPDDPGPHDGGPLARELADELNLVGRWLDRHADRIHLCAVDGTLASSARPVPIPGRAERIPHGREAEPRSARRTVSAERGR